VRGDIGLTVRLLLRRQGVAGLVVSLGGAMAIGAATRPWYRAVVTVQMLGDDGERTVASLAGIPSLIAGWAVVALGLVAAVLGIACAADRPHRRTTAALAVSAAALAVITTTAAVWRPPLQRMTGAELDRLRSLADRLPIGVEMSFEVVRGDGLLWLAAATVLVVAGTVGARSP
jgi:hypothetical protein